MPTVRSAVLAGADRQSAQVVEAQALAARAWDAAEATGMGQAAPAWAEASAPRFAGGPASLFSS